ncbi:Aste57867_14293 [Aphanomyces stellatus]|uniref:Aste57867_14293 protein n=1 Tax=Aphanomyces stellatus TaxID=120398 RepID=A0A485L1Z5_9STRA|nr:hypothetical protein As57867_014241 [Aphanomyces stellatus]VFT91118.1 Aste57867_14293 [Aphanomyces stellatus]
MGLLTLLNTTVNSTLLNTTVGATAADGSSNSHHVLTSMKIYFVLFAVAVVVYEVVRQTPVCKLLFACRTRSPAFTCPFATTHVDARFLGWVAPALRLTDEEIMETCGLDSLVLIRFLRLGRKVALCGVFLSAFLFPVYATAHWTVTDVDTLDAISLNLLTDNDDRLWSAIVSLYVLSGYTLHLLLAEYKDFIERRHHFMSLWNAQQYSVVITELPRSLRTRENLTKYLDHLFPGQVHAVVVSIECKPLEKLVAQREKMRAKLEHALAQLAQSPGGTRPIHLVKSRGTTVDAIDHFGAKLDRLNAQIPIEIAALETMQSRLVDAMAEDRLEDAACVADSMGGGSKTTTQHRRKDDAESVPLNAAALLDAMHATAFVTFRTLQSAQMAQQLLQTSKPTKMLVEPAPPATDVLWENVGMSLGLRQSIQLVSLYATIAIVLFWTIPSSIVATLSSVDGLVKLVPSLAPTFAAHPWLEGLFKQLGALGLVIMTALAPVIFTLLSQREGHFSEQHIQSAVFQKLGYFQFIQIFFVSVIVGSVVDSLQAILDNPVSIITMLAKSIPAQAANFMSYLVVKTGLSLAFELFRVGPLLLSLVYHTLAPRLTPRERRARWCGLFPATEPGPLLHSQVLPDYYQAILLTLTFCPMSPVLCYFSLAYFLASDVVYRRQLLFVYNPAIDSTGLFWHPLYNFVVSAVLVAQFTLLGVLSLKKAPGPVIAAALLPLFTLLGHLNILHYYPRTATFLPLLDCVSIDLRRRRKDVAFGKTTYVQPALLARDPIQPDCEERGLAAAARAGRPSDEEDLNVYMLHDN